MDTIPTTTPIAVSGIIGAVVPVVSGALVPVAMSAFGVVTNGVGTIHAAGGIAATLQYVSTCGLIAAGSTVAVAVPTAAIGILCYSRLKMLFPKKTSKCGNRFKQSSDMYLGTSSTRKQKKITKRKCIVISSYSYCII